MKIELTSMEIQSFKGIFSLHIDFTHRTEISGKNAAGKTTIADAYYWVMADKNYALKSNPPIYPIGKEEATPTVTLNMAFDGHPVKITKKQVRKVSKPNSDGVSKISLSNTYEINDVPKSERDVQKYFNDLGIDMSLFLPLSHPEVFTSQKAQDMRKVLFKMADGWTDKEVCDTLDNDDVSELSKLLDSYSVEEITAMQKATLRKINEEYGKNGEILNSKIEGLELARTENYNEDKLNGDKATLEKRKAEISVPVGGSTLRQRIEKEIEEKKSQLEARRLSIVQKLNHDTWELDSQRRTINVDLDRLNSELKFNQTKLSDNKASIDGYKKNFESFRTLYDDTKAKDFNPNDGICPTCGQKLPNDQLSQKIKEFQEAKKSTLDNYNHMAGKINTLIKQLERENENINVKITRLSADIQKKQGEAAAIEKKASELPTEDDLLKTNSIYVAKSQEIAKLQHRLSETPEGKTVDNSAEIASLNGQIDEINRKLAQNANNTRIAEQIKALRDQQETYEQNRADAEKILYELDLLSRAKNELLTESVNAHFKLVKFRLFTYLKNGSYSPDCTPMIDGKPFGTAVNTALQIRGELDIIDGLQKFYDLSFPVFIDGAEALDSINQNLINVTAQLIFLSVSESKELKVG